MLLITGTSSAPIAGLSPKNNGTGLIFVMRWNLNNASVDMLTRFGGYTGSMFVGDVAYDVPTGSIVVSGVTSPLAIYGDYDALILIYAANLSLTTTLIVGGAGCDGAGDIKMPYVALAIPSAVNYAFGAGTGPALLTLTQFSTVSTPLTQTTFTTTT